MPTYEYRCHECARTFEVRRSMSESSAPASCPDGHENTVKLLSTIALTTGGGDGAAAPMMGAGEVGGGCCGGACGCG